MELNDEKIIHCYKEYIGFVVDNPPTQKEYLLNMELNLLYLIQVISR